MEQENTEQEAPKRGRKKKQYRFIGVGKLHGRVSKGEIIDDVTMGEIKDKLEHAIKTGQIEAV